MEKKKKISASFFDASLMKSLLMGGDQVCFFPGGWMELWEKIATEFDVRIGAEIASIHRETGKRIRMFVNGKMEEFDRLIITTPLNRVGEYLDVTDNDRKMFRKIRSYRMVSTLVKGSIPLKMSFFADNTKIERIGHVMSTECYAPKTRCSVLFQTVPPDMKKEEIDRILTEDLREVGCEVQKIIIQKEWDYFYHASSKDVAGGFHESLNAMQGARDTFYLGSIFNYETVNHCQAFAREVVGRWF